MTPKGRVGLKWSETYHRIARGWGAFHLTFFQGTSLLLSFIPIVYEEKHLLQARAIHLQLPGLHFHGMDDDSPGLPPYARRRRKALLYHLQRSTISRNRWQRCSLSPKLRTPDYSRLSLSRAYRSKVALLPPIGSLGVYKDMGFFRPNPTALPYWGVYVVGRFRLLYHGLD
ncbi:hypothetical protein VNO77_46835 [Canavalia gladiata]|uniref:Uncharacterized protein n=1 Tax=Canavalia gladiata TaxID=3824 RepID=A0AAN9PH41_CANGL